MDLLIPIPIWSTSYFWVEGSFGVRSLDVVDPSENINARLTGFETGFLLGFSHDITRMLGVGVFAGFEGTSYGSEKIGSQSFGAPVDFYAAFTTGFRFTFTIPSAQEEPQ